MIFMAKFKAVLFDLDNTLVDFYKLKNKCIGAAANAMVRAGLQKKPMQVIKELWDLYYDIGWEHQNVFQEYFRRHYGEIDWRIMAKGVYAYRRVKYEHTRSYPSAKKILRELKKAGVRIAVVTDAERINAWMRLVEIGLADEFEVVVSAPTDTGVFKPDPKPFNHALQKLGGVKPSEALFVGDSIHKDVAGAKNAGLKTALASYGRTVEAPHEADYEFQELGDVLKAVL